jgi:hypothetical protein
MVIWTHLVTSAVALQLLDCRIKCVGCSPDEEGIIVLVYVYIEALAIIAALNPSLSHGFMLFYVGTPGTLESSLHLESRLLHP